MENLKEKLMMLQQETALSNQTMVECLQRNVSLEQCFGKLPFCNKYIAELTDKQTDRYQMLDELADVYGSCIKAITRHGFTIEELNKVVSLKLVDSLMKTDPSYSSYLSSKDIGTVEQWEYYRGVIEEIPSKVEGYVIKPDKNSSFFHYLLLQRVTDGWDYSIWNTDIEEIDDGVYDNPYIGKREVITHIVSDFAPNTKDSGSLILFWERLPESFVEKIMAIKEQMLHIPNNPANKPDADIQ